jgi:uncharacterized protein YegJ (DUF2314 family)
MNRVTILLSLSLLLFSCGQLSVFAAEKAENLEEKPNNLRLSDAGDPNLAKAIAIARSHWSEFVSAFQRGAGSKFSVKKLFRDGEQEEHMWIRVSKLDGANIEGTLNSEPILVKNIKQGDSVRTKQSAVEDWMYVDSGNKTHGIFSAAVLTKKTLAKPAQE